VVQRTRLPAPAAVTVYELTARGAGLRPVLTALAHWGARSLGPPTADVELHPGWLVRALKTALGESAPVGTVELRSGDEVACVVDGEVRSGGAESPDVVVGCDAAGVYHLLVDGVVVDDAVVEGDRGTLERLAAAVPGRRAAEPVTR
jgi:hypothetical protein